MIEYRLQLRRDGGGTDTEVCGHFSPDFWAVLRAYCEQADRLEASDWVAADCPGTWRLLSETGVEEKDAPSPSAIAATLHFLRSFVLQSELLYFPSVTSRLRHELNHELARGVIERNVRMFAGKDMRAMFRITSHELELTTEPTLDLWLSAFEYHPYGKRTPEKRERFLAAHGGPPDQLAKAVFRDMLRNKVFAVLNIRDLIRAAVVSNGASG